jgi:CCR4-NOT transcriptional regulation complex NOT5 subunit
MVMHLPSCACVAGEDQQLLAAEELQNRKWFFHRTCLIWMKPKNMVKSVHDRLGDGEQGEIEYFDTTAWAIKTKPDFFLDRRCIEESPSQFAASHRQAQR